MLTKEQKALAMPFKGYALGCFKFASKQSDIPEFVAQCKSSIRLANRSAKISDAELSTYMFLLNNLHKSFFEYNRRKQLLHWYRTANPEKLLDFHYIRWQIKVGGTSMLHAIKIANYDALEELYILREELRLKI